MIRDVRREDLPGLTELRRRLSPEAPASTAAGLWHWLTSQPDRARVRAWVALGDGTVVGWAFARFLWAIERGDVGQWWAGVREDARARGLGGALASRAEAYLADAGARKLETFAHEGSFGQRFAERRGYVQTRAERCLSLDPRTVDVSALPALEAAKAAEGFRLAPLRDVRDRAHELHRLERATIADVPADEPETNVPFDEWLREIFEHPDLDDDGSFVVLAGERIVADCLLRVDREAGLAENEMTGTLPEFRRHGLARLVKLASIRWAAEHGITAIWTANDAENAGMLALNAELGYRPRLVRAELSREI